MPETAIDLTQPYSPNGTTANLSSPAPESDKPKRVSDFVDELEHQLSTALKDYRHHAEEALAKHLENLEKVDVGTQLELARLRAENNQLRDQLSLGGKPKPELMQTVLFHEPTVPDPYNRTKATDEFSSKGPPPGKKKAAAHVDNSNKNPNLKRAETMMLKRKGKGDMQNGGGEVGAPGGSWQQFVAWVPNGAALQQPEPWKPLPPEDLANVPGQGQLGGTQATAKDRGKQKNVEWNNILPGAVDRSGEKDEDAEIQSNSSKSTQETEKVELLEFWHATTRELERARKQTENCDYQSRGSGLTDAIEESQSDGDGDDYNSAGSSRFMIHPHSMRRIVWDTLSLVMVVYDMIMIPMMLFKMPDALFLSTMDWMTRFFWTIDMGWSVSTGVVMPDGKVEMKWGYTMKRYLRSWFCVDIIIVASDWAEFAAGNAAGGAGTVASITRILRIARVARLMRLARAQGVVQALTERIQSDFIVFVMSILKVTLFVVFISHIIGCCWWGIGEADSANSWILANDFKNRSLVAQYLVSLHWALMQFTGGMDDISAQNEGERLFTIFIWIFAFMAACIIVSVLTSNLTQLHIIGGAQSRQLSTLRKYLKQNGVSSNLTLRVQRNAQHAISGDLTDEAVDLLPIVSEPLRLEMHFEMYGWLLRLHPLFADFMSQAPQVVRKLCHAAVTTMFLDSGDVLFTKGEVPQHPKMYFVARGTLKYHYGHMEPTLVREKQWVSEGALWTAWRHRGTLTATSDVKVAVLDGLEFQNIVGKFKKRGVTNPKVYAKDFVEEINRCEHITDLNVD